MARRLEQVSRGFLGCAVAYALATAVWALAPAEYWMPTDIAYAVSANNCALAQLHADAVAFIGTEIWIVEGEVIAPADRFRTVTDLGLWHERVGARHRVRLIEDEADRVELIARAQRVRTAGSSADPPP